MVKKRKEYHPAVKSCHDKANKMKARTAIEKAKEKDSCLIKELNKM